MNSLIKNYVKITDWICVKVGRITMYLVFVMMFILILSFVTRNIINFPLIWIIEMAQFVITAYYILGGSYSMITDDHVRMDLFYSRFSEKNKARMDAFTSIFLFFYLITLLYGSISSLNYTLETNQRLFTAWRPYVWPIKSLMTFGILLMLLQTLSMFFKDLYRIKGEKI
jgi:TRAP-type mannitol/chloroaromatic compound transport system permease small subunit